MTSRFVVTDHALDRFVERHGGIDDLNPGQSRRFLLGELEQGVPFGGQVGNGELYLLPCGLVAAVITHDGSRFVKTVLTREHAIANMESQGATLRPAQPLRGAATPGLDAEQNAELRALAERHFKAHMSRKERNAILRERGFDPAGTAGEIYRAAFRALIDAMWAWKREEYWRRHQAS